MRIRILPLEVTALLVFLLIAGCRGTAHSSLPTLAPTWTPTPIQLRTATVTSSIVTVLVPMRDNAATPSMVSTAPPSPLSPTTTVNLALRSTQPAVSADQKQGATPVVGTKDVRIDEMGPVSIATVVPLPAGAGAPPERLQIPVLALDVPVVEMGWHQVQDASGSHSEWDVVNDAAGHHLNSAYPGEAGNVVISGHNNIGGSVFRSVCVIGEPGVEFGLRDAMILVDQQGRHFTYRVNGWHRLVERNASIIQQEANATYMQPTSFAQLTLVTCWPPSSNTHRVIVTGVLTDMQLTP